VKFIDLFAGIGGTRLAFESVGFECVFSSEWDQHSQKTYEANFGHRPSGDITKIQVSEIPHFDVLVAGFPCQPFSSIGQRKGFDHPTQGTLFYDIVRIIQGKIDIGQRPKSFLLENVKGLKTHDSGNTWNQIKISLEELGYEVHDKILDSSNFGVPQKRERIYIVGFDKGSRASEIFKFPTGTESKVGIGKYVESNVTDRNISDHLQRTYIFKKNDGRPEIITTETSTPVKTLVASYHKIQRLTGTFVRDNGQLRLLSENECKAIMGFPIDFKVPVSRTQMYRQFGNSVAVPVVASIAREIKNALS